MSTQTLRADADFVGALQSPLTKEILVFYAEKHEITPKTVRNHAGMLRGDDMTGAVDLDRLETHPSADFMPTMEDKEFQELVEDIDKHGCLVPLVCVRQNGNPVLVDGRHRRQAILQLKEQGKEPEYQIQFVKTPDDKLLSLVFSLNHHRRHLLAGQRAHLALLLHDAISAGELNVEDLPVSEENRKKNRGSVREIAAEAVGSSGKYVDRLRAIRDEDPPLEEMISAGKVTIPEAERIISDRLKDEATEMAKAKKPLGEVEELLHRSDIVSIDAALVSLIVCPVSEWDSVNNLLKGFDPDNEFAVALTLPNYPQAIDELHETLFKNSVSERSRFISIHEGTGEVNGDWVNTFTLLYVMDCAREKQASPIPDSAKNVTQFIGNLSHLKEGTMLVIGTALVAYAEAGARAGFHVYHVME